MQNILIGLVDKILKEDANSEEAKALMEKLDKTVYEIYGITEEEKKIIEESFR